MKKKVKKHYVTSKDDDDGDLIANHAHNEGKTANKLNLKQTKWGKKTRQNLQLEDLHNVVEKKNTEN